MNLRERLFIGQYKPDEFLAGIRASTPRKLGDIQNNTVSVIQYEPRLFKATPELFVAIQTRPNPRQHKQIFLEM